MSYGCFVEFPHNLSALAPTKYLEDQFTSDPTLVYQEGQTVFAKVSLRSCDNHMQCTYNHVIVLCDCHVW